jgi:hypothetical protein
MLSLKPLIKSARIRRSTRRTSALLLTFWIAGCGGSTKSTSPSPVAAPPGPQTYFAPSVAGAANGVSTFTIDDAADTFSQSTYQLNPPIQQGPQVLNAGVFAVSLRGLRSLGITAQYVANSGGNGVAPGYYPVTYNPPEPGSFATELAGQKGGLVQLIGQPATPLVAAIQCPSLATPQTYQFITIPAALAPPGTIPRPADTWDPTSETAYGSVDVSSSGDTIAFQNIHQSTLPSEGGTGAPSMPAPAVSMTGACGPTFFGSTITVPGQVVITNPGNGQSASGQATIGIGVSGGLLVEDNGVGTVQSPPGTSPEVPYINVLGAGTGAVGLPKPASALDTGGVIGAQYLGFIYAAGVYSQGNPSGWSSHLASFGYSTVPASCSGLTAPTATLIYGGDFTNDDPSTSPDGFGNCDFAIDLGGQSTSTNGLYPNATVWVGAGYAANPTGAAYSFPAVAIAGQIASKYAVFLIGVDSTQPWAIYLLQSN